MTLRLGQGQLGSDREPGFDMNANAAHVLALPPRLVAGKDIG
jgi:hypothetical protein